MNRKLFSASVILFDWDGTLLDSFAADVRAYMEMFRAMEIEWDAAKFEEHYSPDWYRVYRAVRLPRAKWIEADRLWRLAYASETPPLLPGARRILRMLSRKFRLGIVTSGSRARVRKQLRSFELAQYFSACVCAEDASHRKPHPAPIQLAMKRMRASPEETIYIGDSAEDSKWRVAPAFAPLACSARSQPRSECAPQSPTCCCDPSRTCLAICTRREKMKRT